ncbi:MULTISPECIES: hypothetical protein [Photorhabdus]|uniref:Photorhabdus luminescens subsp. laumondii TTO1 complete genome segment 11/17 n=1 Tax=Photorhabdus laumondii subsp. laumondii (strain DSM 15139 / CIP 105565 / TT01) TaxID=243265 RepID=Q7N2U8_PHOLL|nr:hypothetical protein A4R40_14870 [Photorhabdus laumondii subsp. laumondii]NHB61211.1 hypothetical protein [Photorhabdus sp. RW14-46]RAW68060.1 hypothetical protein CKY15_17985 [Photorhabdus sp. S7-51]RAW69411.1 hypothetical protein CKY14_17215 [Photorhabdus sp. S14-60]RAW75547.1 hypothetical protein CKY06_17225 [Photorhabdus sp. S15-56]RAW85869.1 hypothetical protein CKY09_09695 [Photorhabdus sp. S5P8-50]RAW86047.1 hypothetical protein CKY12_09070 [Photorhabdus sp. S12-55]CAE15350.1 unnam
MNLIDLRKLILNSGFSLKELLKIKRNFIILYKDEPDIYDKYQSKTDCFCQYLLLIADEIAIPLIYLTTIYLFMILGMFFSDMAYGVPLMFSIYLFFAISAFIYYSFSVSCNLITGSKLLIFYIRFKIKNKFQSS